MNKKMKKRLIFTVVVVLFLASCAAAPQATVGSGRTQSEIIGEGSAGYQGQGQDNGLHQGTMVSVSDANLAEAEINGLLFMREEEKLARDVYLAMADEWGMNIFNNIAGSESAHMDAVLNLIELSGLDDPVGDAGLGVFKNQDLQALYNDLVDRGRVSLDDALLVGAAIEEIDILDLQAYLLETENRALIEVYQNLLMGSINHLQAFVRSYERQSGESYTPQYLSPEAYEELMASSMDRGGGGGRGMNVSSQGQGRGRQ